MGGSGAGKSWLAERLCSALAPNALRLSLDDFYCDLAARPVEERERVNFDEPGAIDWVCVRGVMQSLSRGVAAEIPGYDFATHTRRPESRRVAPREFILWDGLWLLHEEWLRRQFAWSVFVDCAPDERLGRRIARDVQERGRTPDSVRGQFQANVAPMHERFVEPQRGWATCRVVSPLTPDVLRRLTFELERLRLGR